MRPDEAIKKFEKIKKGNIYLIHQRIEAKEVIDDYSLCDMAISAIEKQIPKKPVMGYAFGEKIREVIKRTDPERAESKTECCPVCGRTLGVSQFVETQTGLRFGDLHCKRCGQAIDWEVGDDKQRSH